MKKRFALILMHSLVLILYLFLSSVAFGQTYYIDFTAGANTNNGTSTSTPWKSHPYMQAASGCTGTGSAPSYSHSAGDIFYFKGGETWPSACWSMNLGSGGSAGNIDYYRSGANASPAWGTGRPVFDANWTSPSSNSMIRTLGNGYITFDSLELKNMQNETAGGSSFILIDGGSNIIINNSYLHGWYLKAGLTVDDAHGGVYVSGNNSVTISNSTVSNTEYSSTRNSGVAIIGGSTVSNCVVHDVPSLCLGCCNVNNNTFYNIGYPVKDFDSSYHTNGLYITGEGCRVYNNLIYNFGANAAPLYPNVGSGGSGPCQDWTQYVYNNVVILGAVNDVPIIMDIDPEHGGTNDDYCGTIYAFNNTLQSNLNLTAIRTQKYGSGPTYTRVKNAYIQNNHIINSAGAGGICTTGDCGTPQTLVNTFNVPPATGVGGYSLGNKYAPTSVDDATINRGTNLSSYFTTDRLGTSRPQGSAWDIGAYEYISNTPPGNILKPPLPPGNIIINP